MNQAWSAFLGREPSERPLLSAEAGFLMPVTFPSLSRALGSGPVCPDDIQVDPFLEDIERLYLEQNQLGDDLPFVAAPFVYVPWVEAIMGCPVYATETGLWAGPCVEDWATWPSRRAPWAESAWAQKLLQLVTALVNHSSGRYQVSHTLMRGVADVLCAMRGASRFVLDFFDFPTAVQDASDYVAETWIQVAEAQLSLIPPSHDGYVGAAGWRVWAPDRLIWLQEDAMALLSPDLFRGVILPQDARILSHFPCTAFHLHASALWAVDALLSLDALDVLEINYESARIDEQALIEACIKAQAHKPLVIWKEYDRERFPSWLEHISRHLSARGLQLAVATANLDEAVKAKQAIAARNWADHAPQQAAWLGP